MPRIEIADTGEAFAAEEGETILAAAQRAELAFPYSCQAGNCGTCKCELIDGDVFQLEHSQYALTEQERRQGLVLACRSQVWSDTRIRRLAEDDVVVHPSRILQCRVARLEQLTHDIRRVSLTVEQGGPLLFSAGQYVNLEFAPGLSRHYSMASIPGEPLLEFHIRHMPDGRCSGYVARQLREGDAVQASGPCGTSYLRDSHAGPILLIAGGSGLAPIQSIVRARLDSGSRAPVHLYFGVRSERDVYNEPLLRELAARHGDMQVHVVLSDEMSPGRRSGFVHHAAGRDLPAELPGWKAYLAGPPAMVEAATALLRTRGMAARDIHADAFYNQ